MWRHHTETNEQATSHSINSSTDAMNVSEGATPKAFAAVWLRARMKLCGALEGYLADVTWHASLGHLQ
jgi:hypothetical protein